MHGHVLDRVYAIMLYIESNYVYNNSQDDSSCTMLGYLVFLESERGSSYVGEETVVPVNQFISSRA